MSLQEPMPLLEEQHCLSLYILIAMVLNQKNNYLEKIVFVHIP